jgi:hypothetical protein
MSHLTCASAVDCETFLNLSRFFLCTQKEHLVLQDDNDLYGTLPLSVVDENIGKIVPPAEKKGAAADSSEVAPLPCHTGPRFEHHTAASRADVGVINCRCCHL